MSNDTGWLWVVGIVVVGAALFLLAGTGPQPAVPPLQSTNALALFSVARDMIQMLSQ